MTARASFTLAISTLCAATLATTLVVPSVSAAEEPGAAEAPSVGFVVVRENGSGSASAAQSYLDTLLTSLAKRVGWAAAGGKYFTKRSKAAKYIEEAKPSFGFFSFGAYLGMRKAHGLTPMAVADASASGGAQYFVISKTHFTLEDCKGKTLASNHADDARFIDTVVSGEAFDLGDFTLVPTRRPVQTIKAVINGEAECALIDDAQISALTNVDGGAAVRPVWASEAMPAVVVVSFGRAPNKQVEAFSANVEALCKDDGKAACDAAGLTAPRKLEADAYAAQQAAYDG